jgi:membrane-associated HD superfamily phosphohydrolase
MMADAIEAASRALPEYTEESIDKMVENIIDAQIAEGSFKNAPITFQHIEKVKKVFKEKLKNIYHSRIHYPELITNNK